MPFLELSKGGRAFKVVALARLTPIPFGLQNGIFAVSSVLTLYIFLFKCLWQQSVNLTINKVTFNIENVIS